MPSKHSKTLVLSLIKDDLIHTKLTSGLTSLGLNAEFYALGLSDTVFKLLGVADTVEGEQLFEHYLELKGNVRFIESAKQRTAFDALALAIYDDLVGRLGSG